MNSSLIVYNLAALRGTSPALAKNSEHTYIATLPKLLIKYCVNLNYSLFKYWYQPTGTSLVVGSYFTNDTPETTKQIFKTYFTHPSYICSTSALSPYYENFNKNLLESYDDLYNTLLLKHHYATLIELYKIHILIVLNCISTENNT